SFECKGVKNDHGFDVEHAIKRVAPASTSLRFERKDSTTCAYSDDRDMLLLDLAITTKASKNIVAVNLSFNADTGATHDKCDMYILSPSLQRAMAAGIAVVVSAGNFSMRVPLLAVVPSLAEQIATPEVYPPACISEIG